MRWQFDGIETFLVVMQAGGITKAAHQLGMTKSIISKRIRDLEASLSVQLFHRRPGAFVATEAGEALYEQVAPLLHEVSEIIDGISSHSEQSLRGRLRISTPMSFGTMYLGPIVAQFARQHPSLQIAVDYDDRPVALSMGGYDLALRIGFLPDSNLRARRLGECPRILCCSPEYIDRMGMPKNVDSLADHDAIDYSVVHARQFWEFQGKDGQPVSVAMHSRVVANNGEAIRDMAIAGLGIASLPIFLAAEPINTGKLIAIPLELEQRPYPISALYPNTSFVPMKVRVFIDYLIENIKEIASWGSLN